MPIPPAQGDPVVVLLIFNALSMLSAIICARRSYLRHRRTGRAVMAGIGGLLILPLIVVVGVYLARPRDVHVG